MTFRQSAGVLTLAASAALVTTGAARAQQQQQAGPINFVELFQALDADNDAVIARGEVPESGRAAFDRLVALGDTNGDGKIDRVEYRSLLESVREALGPGGPAGAGRFQALDKNGDGKVSREEFPGRPAVFQRLDADKDGFITQDEARRFRPAAAPAAAKKAAGTGKPAK